MCSDRRATRLLHPAINSPPSEVKNLSRFGCESHFRFAEPCCPLAPLLPPVSTLLAVPLLYGSRPVRRHLGGTQRLSIFQRPAARSRAHSAQWSGTSSHLS